jgi:thioredoxin reductase (NADPH)
MVEARNDPEHHLPVVFFPDGTVLVEPDVLALASQAGMRTQATQPFYDVLIIGAQARRGSVPACTRRLRATPRR